MQILTRFYWVIRFFSVFFGIIYAYLACVQVYEWNEMIFLNYWYHTACWTNAAGFFSDVASQRLTMSCKISS